VSYTGHYSVLLLDFQKENISRILALNAKFYQVNSTEVSLLCVSGADNPFPNMSFGGFK